MYAQEEYDNTTTYEQPETIDSLYAKMNEEFEQDAQDYEHTQARKKKRRKAFGAGVITATIIAAIAIAAPLVFRSLHNEKAIVGRAVSNLAVDMQEISDETLSTKEMEDVFNMVAYGDSQLTYSVNVSGIESVPMTIGVDGDTTRLFDNRMMESHDTLSVMNSELADIDLYASDTDLYIYTPLLGDSGLFIPAENLAETINNGSEITALLGITIPEYDYRPFGDGISKDIHIASDVPFSEKYKDELTAIAENMEVTRETAKSTRELANGSVVECKTFDVKVDQKDADALLNAYVVDTLANNTVWADMIAGEDGTIDSISIDSDVRLEVDIDEDGRIRFVRNASPIMINKEELHFRMAFGGIDREADSLTVTVKYKDNGYTLSRELAEDGKVSIKGDVGGRTNAGFVFDGRLDYDEESSLLAMDIEQFGVSRDGSDIVRVSGNVEIKPSAVSEIEFPQKETTDIGNMNMLDLFGLTIDLGDGLDELMNIYRLIGGF